MDGGCCKSGGESGNRKALWPLGRYIIVLFRARPADISNPVGNDDNNVTSSFLGETEGLVKRKG
jgi:hypothetical protein